METFEGAMGNTESQLALLEMYGVINAEQRAAVLMHPQREAIGADTDAIGHLVWMVEQGIIDDVDVLAAAATLMPYPDEHLQFMRMAFLAPALPPLEARRTRVNGGHLDELLALGMITESERDCALQTPPRFALKSPGQMLAWLVNQEVILPQRLEALQAQLRMDQFSEAGVSRLRIMEDAHANRLALQEMHDGAVRPPSRPRPRFGVCAALFACGLFAGYHAFQWWIAVPACDAASTESTVSRMVAGVAGRLGGEALRNIALRDVREVGYVAATRQRGCTATLVLKEETLFRKRVEDLFNHVDPDRTREIAEIEPIGNCRAVEAGAYACRVIIERNDPLMSAFGMPAEILNAEFTFERGSGGGPWRLSGDFNANYARARAEARHAFAQPKPDS